MVNGMDRRGHSGLHSSSLHPPTTYGIARGGLSRAFRGLLVPHRVTKAMGWWTGQLRLEYHLEAP